MSNTYTILGSGCGFISDAPIRKSPCAVADFWRAMKTSVQSLALFLFLSWSQTQAYKPVIIVHGLNDGPDEFKTLTEFIEQAHPGTEVKFLDLYDDKESIIPLWTQVMSFRPALETFLNQTKDGAHLLCFSQGGLICRGLLSIMPDHSIHTFIALSSPMAGQYGVTHYIFPYVLKFLREPLKEVVYKFCYWVFGQQVSFCQYWNDPHQRDKYLQYSSFMAVINGEKHHRYQQAWKKNFVRIKKLVLIGGPDDGVITPWQSSHFGFYNSEEMVMEMKRQPYYRKNTFGLKTLDSRGDVAFCEQSGVEHTHWHNNRSVFSECIQDWLI